MGGTHPIQPDELEALRELKRIYSESPFVFCGEGTDQLSTESISRIVKSAAKLANLGIGVHPHTLRHSCGYALASKGYTTRDIQEYLGHRNIQNTVIYTEISPSRFQHIEW
jgi:type 1 fimbriae regulatory protein FimB/type 1 fimbriae regulatory protein FimE